MWGHVRVINIRVMKTWRQARTLSLLFSLAHTLVASCSAVVTILIERTHFAAATQGDTECRRLQIIWQQRELYFTNVQGRNKKEITPSRSCFEAFVWKLLWHSGNKSRLGWQSWGQLIWFWPILSHQDSSKMRTQITVPFSVWSHELLTH